jgi:DNA polymerase-3 subunit beta
MKITIQKSIIENILVNAQAFLEKKDTSQITSHIYMDVFDSVLTLKATDYEIGFLVSSNNIYMIESTPLFLVYIF